MNARSTPSAKLTRSSAHPALRAFWMFQLSTSSTLSSSPPRCTAAPPGSDPQAGASPPATGVENWLAASNRQGSSQVQCRALAIRMSSPKAVLSALVIPSPRGRST